MPLLSRLAVRCSLLHLAVGVALGVLLLSGKAYPDLRPDPRWLGLHRELLTTGWLLQLAFGVAYWILPRKGGRRPRPALAGSAFGLLNLGIAAVAAAELGAPTLLLPAGRATELAAAVLFALHAWPRIRTTLADGA